MYYKTGPGILILMVLILGLSACGDPTNQTAAATTGAASVQVLTPSSAVSQSSAPSATSPSQIYTSNANDPVIQVSAATNSSTLESTTALPAVTSIPTTTGLPTTTITSMPVLTATPMQTATSGPTATSLPTNTPIPVPTNTPIPVPARKDRLVYSSQGQIYLINADGTGKTKVTKGASPVFSPDGKKIAFVDPQGQDIFTGDAVATINSINLDGTGRQSVCKVKAHILLTLLRWSPRGKYIAYHYYPTNTGGGLPLLGLCDTGVRQASDYHLNNQDNRAIYDWTPDGNNSIWEIASSPGDYNLYYGDPDKGGSDLRPVTTGQNRLQFQESQPLVRYYDRALISPDGTTVAVIGSQLFFVSLPGQKGPLQGQTLSDPGGNVLGMAWAGDGKALAVITGQYPDQGGQLKIIDLSSGKANGKLTTIVDNATSLDWIR